MVLKAFLHPTMPSVQTLLTSQRYELNVPSLPQRAGGLSKSLAGVGARAHLRAISGTDQVGVMVSNRTKHMHGECQM